MVSLNPDQVSGDRVRMLLTHPKHMAPEKGSYVNMGRRIIDLKEKTGADMAVRSGTFEKAMLQALDRVSGDQQLAGELARQAVTDPDSVDIHDITIAQAKANMSLGIARNVLNRLVQGWRDLINTR
ncbi:MAG: flagellar hook-basal body complex protein FliE [Treponema sp.]|jgi:flagellar hook-basal body complex protein FliE|nr:flagellar hook-basal body complex protein FliE [Treponema sp.]